MKAATTGAWVAPGTQRTTPQERPYPSLSDYPTLNPMTTGLQPVSMSQFYPKTPFSGVKPYTITEGYIIFDYTPPYHLNDGLVYAGLGQARLCQARADEGG
jgi:hypothetical protein